MTSIATFKLQRSTSWMLTPTSPSCSEMLPLSHLSTPSLPTNLAALTRPIPHTSVTAFPGTGPVASLPACVRHHDDSIEDARPAKHIHRDRGTHHHIKVRTCQLLSRTLCFAFIFEVVITRCDKMARDCGIVHMITTRANVT